MNISHLSTLASIGGRLPHDSALFLLYLGPETIMPVASFLAAILGFLLIFWRLILKGAKKVLRPILARFRKGSPEEIESSQPATETLEDH